MLSLSKHFFVNGQKVFDKLRLTVQLTFGPALFIGQLVIFDWLQNKNFII